MKRLISKYNGNNKIQIYNEIIDEMMKNDPNSSIDTLLTESASLTEAIYQLNNILDRIINEEESPEFYIKMKDKLQQIS